uniref:Heavy metal tolerance protein n=1 Tax=Coccidioides posadasii RMSCC 3488 TaxID=454284 RepID=A0A0J6FNZ6_COCPO|nr:heavy metal tolerance protein [Coccidioides posadasii RMSCC 3488]
MQLPATCELRPLAFTVASVLFCSVRLTLLMALVSAALISHIQRIKRKAFNAESISLLVLQKSQSHSSETLDIYSSATGGSLLDALKFLKIFGLLTDLVANSDGIVSSQGTIEQAPRQLFIWDTKDLTIHIYTSVIPTLVDFALAISVLYYCLDPSLYITGSCNSSPDVCVDIWQDYANQVQLLERLGYKTVRRAGFPERVLGPVENRIILWSHPISEVPIPFGRSGPTDIWNRVEDMIHRG